MHLEFLGTGDCAGVPVYGCSCDICSEATDRKEMRRRSCCARVASGEQTILIDAGIPDLGEVCSESTIDRLLLSHYHVDHVLGLFPMRWGVSERPITVHGPEDPIGCADLLKHSGIFDFSATLAPFTPILCGDIEITPLPLNHSKPSLGFAITCGDNRLAWLCDTSTPPVDTCRYLKQWQPEVMVLDCTFPPLENPHPNHNDINSAMQLHEAVGPALTYLTHISHRLDLWLREHGNTLPADVRVAADGMVIHFTA